MRSWHVARRAVTVTGMVFAMAAPASHAQSGAMWHQRMPKGIAAFDYTMLGSLLIRLRPGLLAIDPASGKTLWSREDADDSRLVPGIPLVVARTPAGAVILDLRSGEERWNRSTLGLTAVKGVVPVPARGWILVYGETADSPYAFTASEYETGRVVWKTALPYSGKRATNPRLQDLRYAFDTDRTLVFDPEDDGLLRLDVETGTILWRLPESALASRSKPLELVAADGKVFGSYGRRILAVGLENGTVLWHSQKNFATPIAQMEPTIEGLLIRGDYNVDNNRKHWHPFITLLDAATGATKWTTEKTDFQGRSEMRVEGSAVVIGLKEGLGRYDLASGKALSIVALPEFAGGDDPCCLERFSDGRLLVSSSQNLRMLDRADRPLYSIYLAAPGRSLADKIATVAAAAALEGMNQRVSYYGPSHTAPMVLEAFTQRFKATLDAERFVFILTEEKGFGGARFALVRIDKDSGKEAGRVWFPDRAPWFKVDPATGIVAVADGNTLYALRFPPA